MADREPNPGTTEAGGDWFAATHWSVVLAAKNGDSAQASVALEKLCRIYWRPLYAFIRRQGHAPTEAQDLTQEFFARFLAKDWLGRLQDQRGKFRSFLLTFLKHFLADERTKAGAQKRGGDKIFVSWEDTSAEERYFHESVRGLSPDQIFDYRWAQSVLEQALERLRQEYEDGRKGALFAALKDLQTGDPAGLSYAQAGAQLGLAEGTIKSAMHRLRRRHREILREEIARTVGRAEEVDEEIRTLLAVLTR